MLCTWLSFSVFELLKYYSYDLFNKMVFSCCVITCRQKGGVKMHTFPYSIPELYNEWLRRIQRVDFFDMVPKKVATNYRICEKHFNDFAKIGNQCRSRTGLKKFALPTLHLPGFQEIPTKENSILSKNSLLNKTPEHLIDKSISRESSLSAPRTQDIQKIVTKDNSMLIKNDSNESNCFVDENSKISQLISNSIETVSNLEENKTTSGTLPINELIINNSEIFDDTNVSLEMCGLSSHLTDFDKIASKDNSLLPCTEIMDEIFLNYPKSSVDVNVSLETSLGSLYTSDDQRDSCIKQNSVLSSTMAAEEHNSDTSVVPVSHLPCFEEISKKKTSVSLSDLTMEELFANNPELFFDLNLPFDTNLPEIATFGFQELDITDTNHVSLETLKRKAPSLNNDELRTPKQCRSEMSILLNSQSNHLNY